MKRYFKVTAKRGHCGGGRYLPICFAFAADNLIAAMDRAKEMPGVKHTEMVLSACEISFSEYVEIKRVSAYKRAEGKE